MSFRVEVTESNSNLCWYSDRIGEIFEVEESDSERHFICVKGKDTGAYILKENCKIVQGIVSKPGVNGAFTGDN